MTVRHGVLLRSGQNAVHRVRAVQMATAHVVRGRKLTIRACERHRRIAEGRGPRSNASANRLLRDAATNGIVVVTRKEHAFRVNLVKG